VGCCRISRGFCGGAGRRRRRRRCLEAVGGGPYLAARAMPAERDGRRAAGADWPAAGARAAT
jgi:hypothetical protein